MKNKNKSRLCKNKQCLKTLPEIYKYRYCESCRNKRSDKLKNVGKGALTVSATILGLVLVKNTSKD
ncbi:hypothetical protein [Enterococcus italicus]|jgi:hypothetical protein|uniref:Uncharacterized protein n=1 Tax=Enterococcus italicus (strain DSM 15952 / CCUG 50447 / LMG 22039 / TP 1.5) TaxID=888064 RepID=E6LHF1_ENTI1|nr:hypothetical protein [Enterococcus italicus]EFU73350.1 hypothetical protein HMPREF9088_1791 [Enterococcus italicus DSM 15952]